MRNRVKIHEAIVVEGRYDKNTLTQLVDTCILETGGFRVFKNNELLALIRRLAEGRGVIILTDGDSAGFLIRGHLKGTLPLAGVKHAYIPDIPGKERRKAHPSREGKLGVEGMSPELILQALRNAGATFEDTSQPDAPTGRPVTKADLFNLGLSGGPDSQSRRKALLKALQLPEHMSTNAMLQAINALYNYDAFIDALTDPPDTPIR